MGEGEEGVQGTHVKEKGLKYMDNTKRGTSVVACDPSRRGKKSVFPGRTI